MFKNNNVLSAVYLVNELDSKLIKAIIDGELFTKIMESYVANDYELLEYWTKELAGIVSTSTLEELKKVVNNLVQKLENNEYVIDTELANLREIINILKISQES